jgi:hypothetical protein
MDCAGVPRISDKKKYVPIGDSNKLFPERIIDVSTRLSAVC